MTLGSVSAEDCFCSCCGAKMTPYFADNGVVSQNQINQLISESFLTVKGAALFLPRGHGSSPSAPRVTQRRNEHTGDLQQHLQTMFTVLRPEDNIRLAVRLESAYVQPQCTRYMVVVSTNGRQDTEESVVLGVDFSSSHSSCTVGLVLPLWSDTMIHLDGDGGFSVSTANRVHIFKPVSVQAMWSALQSLHKACEVARCHNYYPGSLFLTWVSYYQSRVSSDQACINEWNAMQDVQSHRADSPILFTDVPTERERTERLIKTRLREIMMQKDLENVTSKEIRTELEMQMVCNLREFKEFIDNEMIVILGQMDSPTEIFDHVYLGSEWNASNLEELQSSGVRYILNVTREIDNFFPGMFEYHNIRVYDEEATNLLEYWNDTYKFITKAKKAGVKCLVHCKMGVSRSASTVIAYAMKEYGWDLETAFEHVKDRRAVTKPNPSFMKQLEEYQGILLASKQRHNKLWRSHSDSDLSENHGPLLCKTDPQSPTLGSSDPHNNNTPSLQHFLATAVLQALGATTNDPNNLTGGPQVTDTNSEPAQLTYFHSPAGGLLASSSLCPSQEDSSSPGPCQDPFLLAPPRPQAATVVPEQNVINAALATVAVVTVPIWAIPHPPPSLHPSQALAEPLHLDLRVTWPVPEPKVRREELTLDLPDLNLSELIPLESSRELNSLGCSLSCPLSQRWKGVGEPSPGVRTPQLSPTTCDHDDNNNPQSTSHAVRPNPTHRTYGTSSHLSTDRIDFFSARKKFLGLSQDGTARSLSEQAAQRTPQLRSPEDPAGSPAASEHEEKGKSSPHTEDIGNQAPPPHQHDNVVSVRHIVTEIESISHPQEPVSSPQSSPRSPQQLGPEDQYGETPLTPPSYLQSPSTSPSDWLAGSVRRATKQLEQRLRQELDLPLSSTSGQRSPQHSPSTDCLSPLTPGTDCLSPHIPSIDCPSLQAPTTDCLQQDGQSSAPELRKTVNKTVATSAYRQEGAPTSPRELDQAGSGVLDMDVGQDLVSSAPAIPGPLPDVSCPPLVPPHAQPQDSATVLRLEGVTTLDSDTDVRSAPLPHHGRLGLTCSSDELAKIQQTLRELQAFLFEAGRPGAAEGSGLGAALRLEGARGSHRRKGQYSGEAPGRQRAMEVEARIRQAGLTPPSLMKRSASLAKLDRLELSANDLSDWDLCPSSSNHNSPLHPPAAHALTSAPITTSPA
ncbi:hypothetical protein UPYG_G00194170 [Umbra pygmaea]|uniref:protein-serine/threonine phosphatase n=1 Tax=Umbra pygmaea TaxID=75934 RepID=A0ABD0X2X8_UMBPY